jgi:hypothetical protein
MEYVTVRAERQANERSCRNMRTLVRELYRNRTDTGSERRRESSEPDRTWDRLYGGATPYVEQQSYPDRCRSGPSPADGRLMAFGAID